MRSDTDGGRDDVLLDLEVGVVTEYLNGQLPADQAAEVNRRLHEDAAFRERMAPLILMWSIPPLWQLRPVTPEEFAFRWKQFCWRAGIPHEMNSLDAGERSVGEGSEGERKDGDQVP